MLCICWLHLSIYADAAIGALRHRSWPERELHLLLLMVDACQSVRHAAKALQLFAQCCSSVLQDGQLRPQHLRKHTRLHWQCIPLLLLLLGGGCDASKLCLHGLMLLLCWSCTCG